MFQYYPGCRLALSAVDCDFSPTSSTHPSSLKTHCEGGSAILHSVFLSISYKMGLSCTLRQVHQHLYKKHWPICDRKPVTNRQLAGMFGLHCQYPYVRACTIASPALTVQVILPSQTSRMLQGIFEWQSHCPCLSVHNKVPVTAITYAWTAAPS